MMTEIKWSIKELIKFMILEILCAFGNEIRNNVISLDTANIEQTNLLSYIYDFTKKTKPRNPTQRK